MAQVQAQGVDSLTDVITGSVFSKKEDAARKAYLDQILAENGGLTPPKIGDVSLDKYKFEQEILPETIQAGADVQYRGIDPSIAQSQDMGPSAMEGISLDPALRQQQQASLSALQDLANNGGMTAQDKAQLSRIQTEAESADRGRRGAIQQNMAARGMTGSGMDLLAQLQSSQGATDRQAQQGLDVAGMAQQRALDAMQQSGQMAGNMRNQDFSQQSDVARAKDAISQFNAANRNQFSQFNTSAKNQAATQNAQNQMSMDQYNRNTGMDANKFNAQQRMAAQQSNSARRQDVSNGNVDMANKQTMQNQVGTPSQNFQNKLAASKQVNDNNQKAMDFYNEESKTKRGVMGNIAGGVSKAFAV